MKLPALVTIIIPAFNRANKIVDALESILSQTYLNWEAVVIDDGSTDNTKEVVQRICKKDDRVKLICHGINKGAQAARNTGIKAASGEWIAFLDSDDQWLPESLTLRFNAIGHENIKVVHSDAYIQFEGKPLQRCNLPALQGNVYAKLLAKDGPMFPVLLVKKESLEQIGYLDERIKAFQEWDTCIRLAKYFPFTFVNEPTFIYDYRTSDAISRNAIRNGLGYEQNIFKHCSNILRYAGAGALSYHYGVASRWYREGHDQINARRCAAISLFFKFLSIKLLFFKIKQLAVRIKNKLKKIPVK